MGICQNAPLFARDFLSLLQSLETYESYNDRITETANVILLYEQMLLYLPYGKK